MIRYQWCNKGMPLSEYFTGKAPDFVAAEMFAKDAAGKYVHREADAFAAECAKGTEVDDLVPMVVAWVRGLPAFESRPDIDGLENGLLIAWFKVCVRCGRFGFSFFFFPSLQR